MKNILLQKYQGVNEESFQEEYFNWKSSYFN